MLPRQTRGDFVNFVRRIALIVSAVAVAFGLLAESTSSAGAAPASAVTFKGTATCSFSGTLTSNPGIKLTTGTYKLTFSGSLSHCSGNTSQGGVTITGGTLSTSATATGSCTSLSLGSPAGTITWKANLPGAAPTKLSFSNASVKSGTPITVSLPGSGGTSKATGSFAGTKSRATAIVAQSQSTLTSECKASKGVRTFNLTSASKITVA
jgi:hypothetical protein